MLGDALARGLCDALGEMDGLALALGDCEADGDCDGLALADGDCDGELLADGLIEGEFPASGPRTTVWASNHRTSPSKKTPAAPNSPAIPVEGLGLALGL